MGSTPSASAPSSATALEALRNPCAPTSLSLREARQSRDRGTASNRRRPACSYGPRERPVSLQMRVEDRGDVAHEDPPERSDRHLRPADRYQPFALQLAQPGQLAPELLFRMAAQVDVEVAHDLRDDPPPPDVI